MRQSTKKNIAAGVLVWWSPCFIFAGLCVIAFFVAMIKDAIDDPILASILIIIVVAGAVLSVRSGKKKSRQNPPGQSGFPGYCTQCGASIRTGDKFCDDCGGQVTPPPATNYKIKSQDDSKKAFKNKEEYEKWKTEKVRQNEQQK